MWDIGGDAFDSLEGVGILEVASLSLDEPKIEAMIFTNAPIAPTSDDVINLGDEEDT